MDDGDLHVRLRWCYDLFHLQAGPCAIEPPRGAICPRLEVANGVLGHCDCSTHRNFRLLNRYPEELWPWSQGRIRTQSSHVKSSYSSKSSEPDAEQDEHPITPRPSRTTFPCAPQSPTLYHSLTPLSYFTRARTPPMDFQGKSLYASYISTISSASHIPSRAIVPCTTSLLGAASSPMQFPLGQA